MFKQLFKFLNKNIFKVIVLPCIFALFLLPELSLAIGSDYVTTNNSIDSDTSLISTLNTLIWFLTSMFWIIWGFVSWLLSSEWINWSIFWIDNVLKQVWVFISNIVYLVFAGIFIFIAFVTITWVESSNYELKKALPKLIAWILIVPFTWFIVQFVISITTILTYSVIYLPLDSIDYSKIEQSNNKTANFCQIWIYEYTKWTEWWSFQCWAKNSESLQESISGYWAYSIVNYYLNNLIKLESLNKSIKFDSSLITSWVPTISMEILNTLFNMLALLFLAILFFIIFAALFVRIIWMWIYIMFSPVLALAFFFWKDSSDFFKKFNFSEFISLAMVPVYVSWALSLWVVFLTTFKQWVTSWINSFVNINYLSKTYEGLNSTVTWTELKIWELTIFLNWINLTFPWSDGVSIIWTIIAYIVWISFLRISVLAALKSSEITKSVAVEFEFIWKAIADFAKSIPKYTPIPIPWFWGQTLDSIWRWISQVDASMASASAKRASPYENKIYSMLWANISINSADMLAFKQKLDRAKWPDAINSMMEELKNLKFKYGRNDSKVKELENYALDDMKKKDRKEYYKNRFISSWVWSWLLESDWINSDNFAKVIMWSPDSWDINRYRTATWNSSLSDTPSENFNFWNYKKKIKKMENIWISWWKSKPLKWAEDSEKADILLSKDEKLFRILNNSNETTIEFNSDYKKLSSTSISSLKKIAEAESKNDFNALLKAMFWDKIDVNEAYEYIIDWLDKNKTK